MVFLTLKQECRLSAFENWMPKKILGPLRHEITEEWRRLHKKELSVLLTIYYQADQINKNEMGGI